VDRFPRPRRSAAASPDHLWGTSPYDPLSLVLAVAVILAIGPFACYVPAARAVRIDPVAALRLD
jgi:ABC-type antimicrobial peptide transport system permease subunit